MRTIVFLSLACVPIAGVFAACVGDQNTPTGADSSTPDTSTIDSSAQETASPDAGGDVADAGPTYSPNLADQTKWQKFDITPLIGTATGYNGGAFDGRYVYYVPANATVPNTILVRYDTQGKFSDVNAWDAYDLKPMGVAAFSGAVFAAPYLYLIPYNDPTDRGILVRYDTGANFKTAGSYATFDMRTNADPNDWAFGAGAYDGKHLYMSPSFKGAAARYDTTAPFDAGASYQAAFLGTGPLYESAVFDGTHIYYAPYFIAGTGAPLGKLLSYDTGKLFTDPASFVPYDLAANLDPNASYFGGIGFDGRYVYLEPYGGTYMSVTNPGSLVVRYDIKGNFTDKNSYAAYDLVNVDAKAKGFQGCTFDGRYLYFAPDLGPSTTVRFDTTGSFGDKNAWQAYDLSTSLTSAAAKYAGAVFDGEFVYYVPYGSALAIRFDAKTPPSLPPFRSSFF